MKSRLMLSGLLLAALLVGLVNTSVLAQDDGPTQPVLGAINIMTANLYITPANGGEETRLTARSVFNPGETLRTDATGVALVTWFYDGTEIILGPESRVTLNSFSGRAREDYMLDTELHQGHLVGGVGDIAAGSVENSDWTIKTPAFTARPLSGQFELYVDADGTTRLLVTQGRVEVLVADAAPFPVDANQYLVGTPGVAETISTDGVTPTDSLVNSGVCTATAPVNLNVRFAPNEDSRRLGGVAAGQVFWVRAGTEGNLWLQVYFETGDAQARNYGWVYGPAVELADEGCDMILRAPLDAVTFGGFGVDQALGQDGESDPIEESTAGDSAESAETE